MRQKIFIYFIALTTLYFFFFKVFPSSILVLLTLVASMLIIVLLLINIVYFNNANHVQIKKHFSFEVIVMMIGVHLSMLPAYFIHGQSYGITLLAQHGIYFILFYFLLHQIRPTVDNLFKVAVVLGSCYLGIYIVQYLIFPATILNTRIESDRGTIRIFMFGGIFAKLAFFYFLHKVLTEKIKWQYVLYLLVFFVVQGVLSGTRQALAQLILTVGLFVLLSKQVKSKAFVIFIFIIMGGCVFLVFKDIFLELIALTLEHKDSGKEPVRIAAIRFFLNDFMSTKASYVIGNGADHMSSPYGMKIYMYKIVYGFYQSDIGIIGDYTKYGALYVLSCIIIILKIIFGKVPFQISFVRYAYLGTLLTIATGAGFFTNPEGLLVTSIVFYVFDHYVDKNRRTTIQKASEVKTF